VTSLSLEVVTAQRLVYAGQVDAVQAPGVRGRLGILPHHTPLLTLLQPGELVARRGESETRFAVTGGFLEVFQDQVTVFADAAEPAEEIDLHRAEEARRKAQDLLLRKIDILEFARAEAALRRSLARIKVARWRRAGRTTAPKLPSMH